MKAEIRRLEQVVSDLTYERDSYKRAAQAWVMQQVTEEQIQRYGQEEPGVPLKEFIGDLEQLGYGKTTFPLS